MLLGFTGHLIKRAQYSGLNLVRVSVEGRQVLNLTHVRQLVEAAAGEFVTFELERSVVVVGTPASPFSVAASGGAGGPGTLDCTRHMICVTYRRSHTHTHTLHALSPLSSGTLTVVGAHAHP